MFAESFDKVDDDGDEEEELDANAEEIGVNPVDAEFKK